jgi:hypothetical protein
VPYTRKDFNLPDAKKARKSDYADVFEETPIFTFGRMLIMQGMYVFRGFAFSLVSDVVFVLSGLWLYLTYVFGLIGHSNVIKG